MWCYKNNNEDDNQGTKVLEESQVERAKKRIAEDYHPLSKTKAENAFPMYLWALKPIMRYLRGSENDQEGKKELKTQISLQSENNQANTFSMILASQVKKKVESTRL